MSAPIEKSPSATAGGWGSARAVAGILVREHVLLHGSALLTHQNKPDGFMCVSCSWAKPGHPHPLEFCENGAKATAWDITTKTVTPEFFAEHTCADLLQWSDHDLEKIGRLTAPMRWNAGTDKYEEIAWQAAFDDIGGRLRSLEPDSVVFYASGRASLETSYMYALFARLYGTNNLPDSSNMCHESTSVGLPKTIGVPVGTVTLEDFEHTDCMFFFGHNTGTNAPRMLHQLQDAREQRDVPIVTFNPLREPGLVAFRNPQAPMEMVTGKKTQISTQYHQIKVGGDTAALVGLCKYLIEEDDRAQAQGNAAVLDHAFIAEHTHGYEDFADAMRSASWDQIERHAGLTRAALESAGRVYAQAKAAMVLYGMGLTQHRNGVLNVQMVSNLLLLKGNIGKPGAGVCPIRGHSNVQGQRTVGITEKPQQVPADKLKALYHFDSPTKKGMNTVEACEGILDGRVKAFIGLGGNFARATPDHARMEPAWSTLDLTVSVATKLNRSHLLHGRVSYLLPCLSRIEIDRQAGGEQAVSVEDSTGCFHGSRGRSEPTSDRLLSEPAIVAGLAKATVGERGGVDWDGWIADYARVRDAIEATYPDIFKDFNARMWNPGGFHRPLAASERKWKTETGKANFIVPETYDEDADMPEHGGDVLRLMTTRGDSQFNTTIYSLDDRFRGIKGTRKVIMLNADDMLRLGLAEKDVVTACTVAHDGYAREVAGLEIRAFDIPAGCAWGYYPECNPLIPLWHHAKESKVPAAKSIPITLRKQARAC
ncbi:MULTISPECIES: FdhF/YdeP family oxidoreductase [unclassified Achromobacter]|uniref:FdhF/YdeP family oxidoreductase n=1 Tax=unclassified Achromobacter TaxID=2626865 RepID=UPI000B51818A|nr:MULTISPECIES: FdhF/YdeP family oxidoreductase [unclassified Achromobacter]OWT80198.1 formate dehydrogenase [Achromobacter sp. HZ34]OWT82081.1 formate dehydrogenase [Achromobacter sp. HZ28]